MRHVRNQAKRKQWTRKLLVMGLISSVVLGSVVTAVANSVDITVLDGEATYAFSMIGADADSILARAQTEGMEPLDEIDECVFSESSTVLTIQRNVRASVKADDTTQLFVVEEGTVLEDLLAANGITVGERDQIKPELSTVLTADTEIEILRSNRVFVAADGTEKTVDIVEGTVADALRAAGVTVENGDHIAPEQDTQLEDGMEITVSRKATVTVIADGTEKTEDVLAQNAAEAIEALGVEVGAEDLIYVVVGDIHLQIDGETRIKDGMVLRVARMTKELLAVTETVAFETVYRDAADKYEGNERRLVSGINGEKLVTYEVSYADGEEVSREMVSEEIVKEAVNEVIERGTKERPKVPVVSNTPSTGSSGKTFVDHTGNSVSYDWAITGECTAYSWEAGSVTSMGTSVQHGYVAVNPNVIPYGSLLYITSPNGEWNYGYCYAMDTGSAAMAGRIVADLFYDSEDYCNEFGRRQMTVYVVEESKWPDGWK